MRELNKIAEDLFNKIRSRFENVSIGDEKAKSVVDPALARFFNFKYVTKDGHPHGNITISLIDESSLKIYFTQDIGKNLNPGQLDEWYQFLRGLRQFARRNLLSFDTRDINKSNLQVRDLQVASKTDGSYNVKEIGIAESNMFGNTIGNRYVAEFNNWTNQIQEGIWATPDSDSDKDKLRELMQFPIETGNDGVNAIGLFYDIVGSDSLFEKFKEISHSDQGSTSDVRPLVINWLETNGYNELASEFNQVSNSQTTTPQANVHSVTESVNTIIKLAGLQKHGDFK
jgi:hypothetical protein